MDQQSRANEVAALSNIVEETKRSKPGDPGYVPAAPIGEPFVDEDVEQVRRAIGDFNEPTTLTPATVAALRRVLDRFQAVRDVLDR